MADISVREIIKAKGMPGKNSLPRGLFGFQRGRVPTDPSGATVEVSLRQHMNLLFGPHLHLNIFAVGQDNFQAQGYADIGYAIHRNGAIYLRGGLGVVGVYHNGVDTVDGEGLDMRAQPFLVPFRFLSKGKSRTRACGSGALCGSRNPPRPGQRADQDMVRGPLGPIAMRFRRRWSHAVDA